MRFSLLSLTTKVPAMLPLRPLLSLALACLLPIAANAANAADSAVVAPAIAASPTEVRPLLLGSSLPDVALQALDGSAVRLKQALAGKPALLVFYRGGWCPYCNLQLQGLRNIRERLDALGYRMIAISPDSPQSMQATLDKAPVEYTLLSDAKADAIRAFGLAFTVDAETIRKYEEYGIDLETASGGQTHHALPVPAVYLVDADGILQFSYVHPDYTVRMPESVVLAAAEALHAEQEKLRLRR
jgi:peroxiredoxin